LIALKEAYNAGLFKSEHLGKNISAGIVVGIVAMPLAMAFAIASGVSPAQGIYTAIISAFFVSIFGGSRVQIAGPTGAFIVLLSGLMQYGLAGLQIATIMAGIILVLMSIAKLGDVIRFIPAPVIVGFTAGIGVTIWVGQWQSFFGFPPIAHAEMFHEKLYLMILSLPQSHMPTLMISLISLAIILIMPKIPLAKKLPAPLWAMVVATCIQSYYQFPGVATIGTAFGGIPQGLPSLTLPEISISDVFALIGPAFTIAMLGAIESLLSAVVADGMTGHQHNSNQELFGQGLANIVCPLFGGIAATGAIARTATNIRQGGTSPLAGLVHCVFLVLVLFFLAPLAANIPLASMAAILFVVSYNMSDVPNFIRLIRVAPRADSLILLITFFLTIFTDLVVAVNVGVVLAILQFMRKMVFSVDVHAIHHTEIEPQFQKELEHHPEMLVYTIEGPLFFGAVSAFERSLAHIDKDPKSLILRFESVPFVDLSGLKMLNEIVKHLQKRGIEVYLCEANPQVRRHMYRAGLFRTLGRKHLWRKFSTALEKCEADLAEKNKQKEK
jgi:SulP family sulfate permease